MPHQCDKKGDQYRSPQNFRDIYGRISPEGIEYVFPPVGEVTLLKGAPIKRPEKSVGDKPHLVKNEMSEGAKGKNKEPELPTASIKMKSCKGDNQEEEKSVGKYSATAEDISKEDQTYRLIDDIGKQ